jgi:hypothetical protein
MIPTPIDPIKGLLDSEQVRRGEHLPTPSIEAHRSKPPVEVVCQQQVNWTLINRQRVAAGRGAISHENPPSDVTKYPDSYRVGGYWP